MGYLALPRADTKTKICPERGTREALEAAGIDKAEQDRIIAEMQKATAGVYACRLPYSVRSLL